VPFRPLQTSRCSPPPLTFLQGLGPNFLSLPIRGSWSPPCPLPSFRSVLGSFPSRHDAVSPSPLVSFSTIDNNRRWRFLVPLFFSSLRRFSSRPRRPAGPVSLFPRVSCFLSSLGWASLYLLELGGFPLEGLRSWFFPHFPALRLTFPTIGGLFF